MLHGPLDAVRPSVASWRWWAGFVVIVAIGLYLSALAYNEGLPEVFKREHVDKIVHFTLAGLLAFFLDGALRRRVLGGLAIPLAAVAVLVPAGIEEYLQRYATFRTSSFWDFAADVAGVVAFIPLSRRIGK